MALAPRKKLWSTPSTVISEALRLLRLADDDVVVDIGAGDGRFLLACAEGTSVMRCIGIEIDYDRASEAIALIADKRLGNRVEIIVGNALEYDFNGSGATAVFLYLVPRGLKIIYSILQNMCNHSGKKVRICTYMSGFPATLAKPKHVSKVGAVNHPEARWPLYYYELEPESQGSERKGNIGNDDTSRGDNAAHVNSGDKFNYVYGGILLCIGIGVGLAVMGFKLYIVSRRGSWDRD